jgi:hypothetical protein
MLESKILAMFSSLFFKLRERRRADSPVAVERRHARPHMTPKSAQQTLIASIDRFEDAVTKRLERMK